MSQHVSLLRQNEHLVFGWNHPFQVKSYFLRVLVVFIDNITKDGKVPFRSSLDYPRSSYIETLARFCVDIKTLITRRGLAAQHSLPEMLCVEAAGTSIALRIEELAFKSYWFRESHQQVLPLPERGAYLCPLFLFLCAVHTVSFSFYTTELPNDIFSPDWLLMASIQYFINSLTDKLQCCNDSSKNEYTTTQFVILLEAKQEYCTCACRLNDEGKFWLMKVSFYDLNL